jgi:hypothetical protein
MKEKLSCSKMPKRKQGRARLTTLIKQRSVKKELCFKTQKEKEIR